MIWTKTVIFNLEEIIQNINTKSSGTNVFYEWIPFLGIDRIMSRCLIPEVRAKDYDILFTPVLRQDEMSMDLTQHGLYIIEIRVRPILVSSKLEINTVKI
jgi:hypothetical protein